jgi:hypothetical protein
MKAFCLLLLVVSGFAVSCERHEFDGPDGTRQLHEPHGAHGASGDGHEVEEEKPAH